MRLEPFTLEGTHVRLEPLSHDHVDELVAAANVDRSTYGWTAVPSDRAGMSAYVDALLRDRDSDSAMPFAQRRVADGRAIGCTRLMNLTWWSGHDLPVEVEIGGTWLGADAQRTPLNTEAKLLLLTHAFETWRVHRVAICTDERNERSRRAIERLGAAFEGVLRHHRAQMGDDVDVVGAPRNTAVYSILPAEWTEIRRRLRERLDG
jgi:N-acetyltransferase